MDEDLIKSYSGKISIKNYLAPCFSIHFSYVEEEEMDDEQSKSSFGPLKDKEKDVNGKYKLSIIGNNIEN